MRQWNLAEISTEKLEELLQSALDKVEEYEELINNSKDMGELDSLTTKQKEYEIDVGLFKAELDRR